MGWKGWDLKREGNEPKNTILTYQAMKGLIRPARVVHVNLPAFNDVRTAAVAEE